MKPLTYLTGYPETIQQQVYYLVQQQRLGEILRQRYPHPHEHSTDRALYQYTVALKNQYLRHSAPLNRVSYDSKIQVLKHALGMHTTIARIHSGKLKAKTEIRIATVFKNAPEDFLRMIVVHELAHLREKSHNKTFYRLCCHMEPRYHQLELDTRIYLTHLELVGTIY